MWYLKLRMYILMAVLFAIVYAVVSMVSFHLGITNFYFYLVLSFVIMLVQYMLGPKIVEWSMGVHYIKESEFPELHQAVRSLAAMAKIPMPKIGISDLAIPNAFAFGRSIRDGRICVTRGIMGLLSKEERDYRIFDTMDGVGIHEVVIETPEHNKSIDMLDVEYVEEVVWAYRERYDAIAKHPEIKYIIIFRNHGRIAGSSLTHPHSQIVAMPVIPQKVWGKLQGVHQYYEYREKCVYCDIIHTETEVKERIIGENNSFIAVCPYASRSPFQMMILPKNHRPTFASCTRYEMRDLARILKDVLCKLSAALGNPPYNYTVLNGPSDRSDNTFHWHIDIFPRLSTPAGFEIGTGMYINTTMPEAAAEFLRQVEV